CRKRAFFSPMWCRHAERPPKRSKEKNNQRTSLAPPLTHPHARTTHMCGTKTVAGNLHPFFPPRKRKSSFLENCLVGKNVSSGIARPSFPRHIALPAARARRAVFV